MDVHGNVTQKKIYDYGNLTTAARTYNNTYASDSGLLSRYIRNRLLAAAVTDGTTNITQVSNTYDAYGSNPLVNRTGVRQHDSANYGTGFSARGNVTSTTANGTTTSQKLDITGMTADSTEGEH